MTESAAYASAPLSRASLRLRRLHANPEPSKPNDNLGVDKTS
jgi:hypothetical protein